MRERVTEYRELTVRRYDKGRFAYTAAYQSLMRILGRAIKSGGYAELDFEMIGGRDRREIVNGRIVTITD